MSTGRIYRVSTGLPDLPSLPDPMLNSALVPVYQAVNSLAKRVSDETGLTQVQGSELQLGSATAIYSSDRLANLVLTAGVAIAYGQLVNFDGTTPETRLRLADKASNLRAHAVCLEPGGIAAGSKGRVRCLPGLLTGVSGIVPGNMYWIGNGGGFFTSYSGGAFPQPVAVGISTTALYVALNWQG